MLHSFSKTWTTWNQKKNSCQNWKCYHFTEDLNGNVHNFTWNQFCIISPKTDFTKNLKFTPIFNSIGNESKENIFQFTEVFWSTWVHKISLQILFCSSQIHIYSIWDYKRNNLISRKMSLLMSIHVFRSIWVYFWSNLVYLGKSR